MRFLKLTLILRDEAWRVRRGAYWVPGSRLKLSALWLGVSLRLCNPLRAALKGAHIFVYASLELSSHWATCRALYCSRAGLRGQGSCRQLQVQEHTQTIWVSFSFYGFFLAYIFVSFLPFFPPTCSFAPCTF